MTTNVLLSAKARPLLRRIDTFHNSPGQLMSRRPVAKVVYCFKNDSEARLFHLTS